MSARRPWPQLAARLAHTFARVVTTAELRKKLLFTMGLIVLFRFGANLPVPGISEQNVRYCSGLASTSSSPVAGVYAMLNVLSGNALLHVADVRTASPIVRYLVYWVIFAVPAWPSCLSFSSRGMTWVSSCTMMLAVM